LKVVLDASAAASITKKDEDGAFFLNKLLQAETVLAPDLYVSEISNVCWKLWLSDKKNAELYREYAEDCIQFVDTYVPAIDLWKSAMTLAQTHMHSVYDMLYVALALQTDATLLSLDKKLTTTCKKLGVRSQFGVQHRS